MSDTGPTSSGSINADIKLDKSSFERTAAEVKAIARELGALDPTVKVDANVAAALSRLGAVRAEEERVGRAGTLMGQQGRAGLLALVAAMPAVLAAAGPVASAAVGLGTAFGVMGGAGVLAVVGIKQAMADGTAAGQAYGASLGVLKDDMDQLAQTAALRMLGSFESVVGDINGRMPFLSSLIGDASGALGQMGGTALTGVLNGLQAMNPLITDGTAALSQFVSWLSAMPSSNGFTTFVDYAVANLPSVMQLIEGLVTTAGHILAAFAPLGPVVLGFLNGFVDVVNSLPLPILAGVVTTATALGKAFQLVGNKAIAPTITAIAESIGLTGVMANLAVPVVGILLAAIAGIAVAGASAAAAQGQVTVALVDYTQALKDDNDALGGNMRAAAAKALQDAGAYDAALKLGISQKLLTDAVLHQGTAWDDVKAKLAGAQQKVIEMSTTQGAKATELANALKVVTEAYGINNDQIVKAQAAAKNYNAAMDQSTVAANANATAYGVTATAYQAGAAAAAQAKAQTDAQTLSMQLQNDAAGLLNAALQLLNNGNLSLATAQTAEHAATNAVTQAFTKNGAIINGNTDAAIANQQAIQRQVQSAQQAAQATAQATGKTSEGTKAYAASKVALENALRAQGELTPAVQAYINKLYDVNNLKVKPTKLEVENAQALAAVQKLKDYIASLQGKTVWLTTHVDSIYSETHTSNGVGGSGGQTRSEGGTIYRANGGSVGPTQYLASGGYSDGPIGTDTVRAWLTPDEYVMKRSSAQSIGQPALNYMNATGKLPATAGGGAPIVHVYIDGKEMRADMVTVSTGVARKSVGEAFRNLGLYRDMSALPTPPHW